MIIYNAAYENQWSSYKVRLDWDRNIFCTFFYEKKLNKALPNLKPMGHTGLITIDSGAHSFFEMIGVSATAKKEDKGKKITKDPYEYFNRYFEWLQKNEHLFDYFVELDLQELVGVDQVQAWREQFKSAGLYHKCITVHHSSNSDKEFEDLLADSHSKYIGIEGIRPGFPMLDYNKYLKRAYEAKVRVHGFAFTRSELLFKLPFYSVDSSSWTTVTRYGSFQIFQEGGMRTVLPVKKFYLRFGAPIFMHNSKRGTDDSPKKLQFAGNEFKVMEEFFTELWQYKGIDWDKQLAND